MLLTPALVLRTKPEKAKSRCEVVCGFTNNTVLALSMGRGLRTLQYVHCVHTQYPCHAKSSLGHCAGFKPRPRPQMMLSTDCRTHRSHVVQFAVVTRIGLNPSSGRAGMRAPFCRARICGLAIPALRPGMRPVVSRIRGHLDFYGTCCPFGHLVSPSERSARGRIGSLTAASVASPPRSQQKDGCQYANPLHGSTREPRLATVSSQSSARTA